MKFLSVITVMILAFTACSKNNTEPKPLANEPKAGSTWIFKRNTYNEAGAVLTTSNITIVAVSATISFMTWLNLVDQSTMQPVFAVQKRPDGWWYIPNAGGNTFASLWFKNPATVNETYPNVYGMSTVKEINASVTVPAGTFNGCYMVEGRDNNGLKDEFWFSNEAALLIKFNTYAPKAAGPASNVYKKESLELVSFTR